MMGVRYTITKTQPQLTRADSNRKPAAMESSLNYSFRGCGQFHRYIRHAFNLMYYFFESTNYNIIQFLAKCLLLGTKRMYDYENISYKILTL